MPGLLHGELPQLCCCSFLPSSLYLCSLYLRSDVTVSGVPHRHDRHIRCTAVTLVSYAALHCCCTYVDSTCSVAKILYTWQVTGPSNASLEYFNYAQNSTSSYQLLVQWEDAYRGVVNVDLQSSRWALISCTAMPEDKLYVV